MREAYTNYTLVNQNLHLYLSLQNRIDNKCNVNKSSKSENSIVSTYPTMLHSANPHYPPNDKITTKINHIEITLSIFLNIVLILYKAKIETTIIKPIKIRYGENFKLF